MMLYEFCKHSFTGYLYLGNINEAVLGFLFAVVTISMLTGTCVYKYMSTRTHTTPSCTGVIGIFIIFTASVITFGSLWLPGAPFDTDSSHDVNATSVTLSDIYIGNGGATLNVVDQPKAMTSSSTDFVSGQVAHHTGPLVFVYIGSITMVACGTYAQKAL